MQTRLADRDLIDMQRGERPTPTWRPIADHTDARRDSAMTGTSSRNRPLAAVAVAAFAALALAACGAGGSSSSSLTSGGAPQQAQRDAAGNSSKVAEGAPTGGGAAGTPGQAADAATYDERIVRTADMTVVARDVPAAAASVRTLAETAKGFVADERTTTAPGDPQLVPDGASAVPWRTDSVLTVRVPNASLDRVMGQIGELGTVLSRSQTSEDVTSQYVDTASRVRSQTASVERVRALLARATNLGQIVQIEGELARRESDLEAVQARLKSLQDRTSLSTLTIKLSSKDVVPPAPRNDNAFLAGLRAGWDALVASFAVVLRVVGALLPFALVAALLAAPAAWWLRRRRPPARPSTG